MNTKILLAGIGGQGVLFIHQVLAECAVSNGQNVTGAETHGMSQRGGSVVSHLKIGQASAPLIRQGTADWVLAFDAAEAYRNLPFLAPSGTLIMNTPGEFGNKTVRSLLDTQHIQIRTVDADGIAHALGKASSANVALLGFACTSAGFPFPSESVRETIRRFARPQSAQLNLQAFDAGARKGLQEVTAAKDLLFRNAHETL
jgi:indolepyruvate ferredoxin oxidoreductase beta subunit